MRSRAILAGMIALALAAILGGAAIASATPPAATSASGGSAETIHLLSTNARNTDLDLGEKGLSAGDKQVGIDDLYQNGKRVGRDGIDAQILYATTRTITLQLAVTLSLPKGDITLRGLVTEHLAAGPKPFVLALTGGTGAYRTARGQARLAIVPNTNDVRYTLSLVR
jgi:allene oxide cyclase-like protein